MIMGKNWDNIGKAGSFLPFFVRWPPFADKCIGFTHEYPDNFDGNSCSSSNSTFIIYTIAVFCRKIDNKVIAIAYYNVWHNTMRCIIFAP